MPVTVILELKFKPDAVPQARDVMGRALRDTRAFAGNLRTDVLVDEDDHAHWLIYDIVGHGGARRGLPRVPSRRGQADRLAAAAGRAARQEEVRHLRHLTG